MKLISNLFIAFALISVVVSCSKDETVPFDVNFTVEITGEAPDATISIINKTTGASSYSWVYGEGASEAGSALQNPANFTVDKAGEFIITLTASDGSTEKVAEAKIPITGNNAILTFTDVAFALDAGDVTYGRLFSIADGKTYRDSEITNELGAKIDLAFGSMSNTMYYFESPDVPDYQLTGATTTKIDNAVSETVFSLGDFYSMTDDAGISGLTISETNESFNNDLPKIILFETASGRKGVIKASAVNSSRLLATIKVQKY